MSFHRTCNNLLLFSGNFSIDISPVSEEIQVILKQEWKTYTNKIDRCLYKIQVIHNKII